MFTLRQTSLTSTLALFFVLAASAVVMATSVIVPSDDEMIIGARAIVRGTVRGISSRYDEQHKAVFTYVTLQVGEVLKGDITAAEIVLKQPGGVTAEHASLIFGAPEFRNGEDVLLYLDTWPDGSLRVYQWFLGKFSINADKATGGKLRLQRAAGGERVTILGRSAGQITDRDDLGTYVARVRARLGVMRQLSAQHEERFFSQTELRAVPLEFTAETDRPVQNFTFINNSYPPRWFEPDSNQPVVFKINPAGAPNGQAIDDMVAAMNAWSTVSGSALRVTNGGTTGGCGLLNTDGENTISFNNCDNYSPFSPSGGSGCSGILAAAGIISFNLAQTRVVNGLTFYRALEGNMSFNPYASCYFGNSCNVREVATHELGHALGFGHSLDSGATMYAYAHFDGRCAGLQKDDADAVRFVYPGASAAPAPPVTIGTTSLPGAQAGVYYAQSLAAAGGTPPYSWSVATGVLPSGLSLHSSGTISGVPANYDSSNFTVRVADAAGQSATKTLAITITGAAAPPPPATRARRGDFDGDGKSDFAVYRSANSLWYVLKSASNAMQNMSWGTLSAPYNDILVPGDYDGDGRSDTAVWRPREANWFIMNSSTGAHRIQNFGQYGDTPVPADYDGDGKTDLAVWRGATGYWYILRSSSGVMQSAAWGSGFAPYNDIPVPGDYDGDGRTDIAVWRPAIGVWFVNNSSNGTTRIVAWGTGTAPYNDIPVPADYDGDGKTDVAVWRPGIGVWFINRSSNGSTRIEAWGTGIAPYNDLPVPGDYDGDGKADIAVWRPGNGVWFVNNSANGQRRIYSFGQNGDVPVVAKQW